jgi:hypothetical protein
MHETSTCNFVFNQMAGSLLLLLISRFFFFVLFLSYQEQESIHIGPFLCGFAFTYICYAKLFGVPEVTETGILALIHYMVLFRHLFDYFPFAFRIDAESCVAH